MKRFEFIPTPIAGVTLVQRLRLEDHRGFLSRLYCAETFGVRDTLPTIAQINQTLTRKKGTVRGMHFQFPPHAEAKLVTCIHGEVFDVAVDLRKDSATFLRWFGTVLSPDNQHSLLIPEGVAHGFQTLQDDCELIYLHSSPYHPDAEGAVLATDSRLAIGWPLAITEMSDRDLAHPMLTPGYEGIPL